MKKIVVIVIILFAVMAGGVSFFLKIKSTDQPKDVMGNDIPEINVTLADGTVQKLNELTGKLIVVLFQPDCDHCQREADAISIHLNSFKRYTLYFVTTDSFNVIRRFADEHNLQNKSNLVFAQTTVESIINGFGQISAPSVYIYSDRKLMHRFNGETPIDDIIESL